MRPDQFLNTEPSEPKLPTLPRKFTEKTAVCRFFQTGNCRSGAKCDYFHPSYRSPSKDTAQAIGRLMGAAPGKKG